MIIPHLLIAKLSLSFIRHVHVVFQYHFSLDLSQLPRLHLRIIIGETPMNNTDLFKSEISFSYTWPRRLFLVNSITLFSA